MIFFFCLSSMSFSKWIKNQTNNPLDYVISCLTTTITDGQVLKILTLIASDIPNHHINTIVVINQLAQSKWTNKNILLTSNIKDLMFKLQINLFAKS